MATDFLRPDADNTDGNWTTAAGSGTDLFDQINETSASDADFIRSGANPSNDVCKIALSNPSGTPTEPMDVLYRYKKTGTGNLDLRVRLLQGTTEIASVTHSGVGSSYVDGTLTLTSPQFAAITDFNDLFIEFRANSVAPLLLDNLTATALGAWSFRKIRAGYSGSAIRLRRVDNGSEADIGFDGSDNLDTSAASSHISGTTGIIAKMYDQSTGGGNDLVQATVAQMPAYNATGLGSKPTAVFDYTASQWLSAAAVAVGAQPKLFINMVATVLTGYSAGRRVVSYTSDTGGGADYNNSESAAFDRNSSGELHAYRNGDLSVKAISLDTEVSIAFDFDGTNQTTYVNNSAGTPVATSSNFGATGTLGIAARTGAQDPAPIEFSEGIIIVNQTVSSGDRGTIDTDQSTYWGV